MKIIKGKLLSKLLTAGILLLLFTLSACGKKEEGRQLGIDGYVYIPEELSLSNAMIGQVKAYDRYLYYNKRYDTGLETIKGISMDGGEDREITLYKPGGDLADYCVDEEGAVYYYLQSFNWASDLSGLSSAGGYLIKMQPDSKVAYKLELPDANVLWDSGSSLAVDEEKRVALLSEDAIRLIDAKGNQIGRISTEEYKPEGTSVREQVTEGTEGRLYYVIEDEINGIMTFYEIVREGGFQLRKAEELSGAWLGRIYGSDYGLLCDDKNGTLYRYDEESASWKEMLYWGDSNLNSSVSDVVWIEEEKLAAYFTIDSISRNEPVLYLLNKASVKELPEKEILVLAAAKWMSLNLKDSILEFNRTNSRYHITVKLYETEDDIARLDSSLVSSDPPDMLDMRGLNVAKYAGKQALEDLTPYLESSTVLDKEDFLENVLEGYTVDGKLICIPSMFHFNAVVGRASQVGSGRGWTMEEVMALTEKYPQLRLLGLNTFEFILRRFGSYYIMDRFVDWESGECSFDSEEFCSLVKWMEELAGGRIEFGYVEGEDYANGFVPENILLLTETADTLREIAQWEAEFGEKISMMGYPSGDGSALYPVEPDNLVGIVAASDRKEGAWEFLEQLLSTEIEGILGDIPVRRSSLMKRIEEEMTPRISEETGELLRMTELWVDGERIPYYYMTEEQADTVLNAIASIDFTPEREEEEEIIDIIMEELSAYLHSAKTLEEVTQIIQNRVQMIVQETL